jgi:hypothetical protein
LKTKAPSPARLDPVLALVDELCALENELAPLKPKIARAEALRKALRAAFDASPATESFERLIDHPSLIAIGGTKLFLAHARITLGALEEHWPAGVASRVVSLGATGSRKLTTFEIKAA